MTAEPETVSNWDEYRAACLAEGFTLDEAYRSYRHAWRCALSGRSWDYEWRIRSKGIKGAHRDYEDASFATEAMAT